MIIHAVNPRYVTADGELLDAYVHQRSLDPPFLVLPKGAPIDVELLKRARFGEPQRFIIEEKKPRFSDKQLLYMRRMKRLLKLMRFCGCEVHA